VIHQFNKVTTKREGGEPELTMKVFPAAAHRRYRSTAGQPRSTADGIEGDDGLLHPHYFRVDRAFALTKYPRKYLEDIMSAAFTGPLDNTPSPPPARDLLEYVQYIASKKFPVPPSHTKGPWGVVGHFDESALVAVGVVVEEIVAELVERMMRQGEEASNGATVLNGGYRVTGPSLMPPPPEGVKEMVAKSLRVQLDGCSPPQSSNETYSLLAETKAILHCIFGPAADGFPQEVIIDAIKSVMTVEEGLFDDATARKSNDGDGGDEDNSEDRDQQEQVMIEL